RLQMHAASCRAVRLGQDERDLKACGMQGLECRGGEFWRAGKDDFHGSGWFVLVHSFEVAHCLRWLKAGRVHARCRKRVSATVVAKADTSTITAARRSFTTRAVCRA